MTEDTQTQTEDTQIGADVAQDAGSAGSAVEVAASEEAASSPSAGPLEHAPEGLNPLDPWGPDEEPADEPEPVHNPNALRGIAAGPAPHPRTV